MSSTIYWTCFKPVSYVGSLKYWRERNKVDVLVSKSAVWDDDAVSESIECAKNWVKDLRYVKSLSGYWKFFLAQSPTTAPSNFHDTVFQDSTWETIPGIFYFNTMPLLKNHI